ncbi:peptide-methionine (S)-S-oxide reductase MsrA [Microbulbifer sp. 2201CG32-9]|uniref:peptide-methionine (S)-S-oxide reductase MsrA n=1 Tax=unclassified Microbulbifer TaxID=2619833 RepID=UPI00345C2913
MRWLLILSFVFAGASAAAQDDATNIRTAVFAGGCFWCMEPPYDKLDGVLETTSGYSGGKVENPTYEQVSAGVTGHAEVVQVKYDADKVSYEKLLEVFWRNVDPLDAGGQFCDRGDQYRTEIFYANEEEKRLAEASRAAAERELNKKIVTKIVPAATFYPAEGYHQNYYQRNPVRYKYYRYRCGRDQRLKELWG